MKNTSFKRNIPHGILLVLSLAAAGAGGWLVSEQLGTMSSTLRDGTATALEVYVGQSLIVVGAAVLGAGLIGVLLALALVVVRALLPTAPAVVEEARDESAQDVVADAPEQTEPAEETSTGDADAASETTEQTAPALR